MSRIRLSVCILAIAGFIAAARSWPQTDPTPSEMLIAALLDGNVQSVKLAQQRGASFTAPPKDAMPLAILATIHPGEEMLQYLLASAYDINQSTPGGYTALMNAAYRGHADQVDLLLRAGANPNQKDFRGWTAADWAKNGTTPELANHLQQFPRDSSFATAASNSQMSFSLVGSIP